MKLKTILLIIRIVIAIVLIQTLRFKFTGHEDSVYIFEKVGLEPYGRIGVGIIELFASILILIPKTIWLGATLAIGVLTYAIILHLTKLGTNVNGDGGLLFITAVVTFTLAVLVLYLQRNKIPIQK